MSTCAACPRRSEHALAVSAAGAGRSVALPRHWLALEGPALRSPPPALPAPGDDQRRRLIEAGLVDVAIVGGADTLSRMPVNGFNSLESFPYALRAVWSRPPGSPSVKGRR
jgi:hypothetical protein